MSIRGFNWKTLKQKPLEIPRRTWVDNIKMDLEIGLGECP
jgi:hypothetical protein